MHQTGSITRTQYKVTLRVSDWSYCVSAVRCGRARAAAAACSTPPAVYNPTHHRVHSLPTKPRCCLSDHRTVWAPFVVLLVVVVHVQLLRGAQRLLQRLLFLFHLHPRPSQLLLQLPRFLLLLRSLRSAALQFRLGVGRLALLHHPHTNLVSFPDFPSTVIIIIIIKCIYKVHFRGCHKCAKTAVTR